MSGINSNCSSSQNSISIIASGQMRDAPPTSSPSSNEILTHKWSKPARDLHAEWNVSCYKDLLDLIGTRGCQEQLRQIVIYIDPIQSTLQLFFWSKGCITYGPWHHANDSCNDAHDHAALQLQAYIYNRSHVLSQVHSIDPRTIIRLTCVIVVQQTDLPASLSAYLDALRTPKSDGGRSSARPKRI
jgi:hypothetical protein